MLRGSRLPDLEAGHYRWGNSHTIPLTAASPFGGFRLGGDRKSPLTIALYFNECNEIHKGRKTW